MCAFIILDRKYYESGLDLINCDEEKVYKEYFGKKVSILLLSFNFGQIVYVKTGSIKSIKEGTAKWMFAREKIDLTEDFCILGRVKSFYACWVSPLHIVGKNRINCDMMQLLKLIGDTENFDLVQFQRQHKSKFLTLLKLIKKLLFNCINVMVAQSIMVLVCQVTFTRTISVLHLSLTSGPIQQNVFGICLVSSRRGCNVQLVTVVSPVCSLVNCQSTKKSVQTKLQLNQNVSFMGKSLCHSNHSN